VCTERSDDNTVFLGHPHNTMTHRWVVRRTGRQLLGDGGIGPGMEEGPGFLAVEKPQHGWTGQMYMYNVHVDDMLDFSGWTRLWGMAATVYRHGRTGTRAPALGTGFADSAGTRPGAVEFPRCK
jgi:hypothetical protein